MDNTQQSVDSSPQEVVTQPTEQPVETVAEQPQSEAPAPEQTGTSEESFFDPTSIPEELKPAYKQMQAAFTKKTQEVAQQRKEAEALRQKAEAYDKYSSHIPIVEEMLRNQPQQQGQNPELQQLRAMYKEAGYSDEAIEMMEKGLGFVLNHFNQSQQQQRQSDWVNSQIAEAAKVDPRLTDQAITYSTEDGDSFTFGQLVEQQVASDPNWVKDPVAATKRAIKRIDALVGTAKKEGKEELSSAAKTKARQFPSTQSSPQSTTQTDMKGSIRDIGREVMKELGMK